MMSSSNVSEETPHPTISVTDGSCSFSMFWRTEQRSSVSVLLQDHGPPSLQVQESAAAGGQAGNPCRLDWANWFPLSRGSGPPSGCCFLRCFRCWVGLSLCSPPPHHHHCEGPTCSNQDETPRRAHLLLGDPAAQEGHTQQAWLGLVVTC